MFPVIALRRTTSSFMNTEPNPKDNLENVAVSPQTLRILRKEASKDNIVYTGNYTSPVTVQLTAGTYQIQII